MNTVRFLVMTSVVLCLAFRAGASTLVATPADQPLVPGEWHLSLSKALAQLPATGIPVVGFWSNTGCDRCATVIDQAINTPEFTRWRQARQLLMVTGEGKNGSAVYNWVKEAAESDNDPSYPFIRVYWVQKDGTVRADIRFSGYPYRANAQTLIDKIESYLAEYRPAGRARFECTPGLEAEPGTVSIPLPLLREYGAVSTLTNSLYFVRTLEAGGTTNWTETLLWEGGDTGKTVAVANEGHYVGGTVTLTLAAAGEADQTVVIRMVAEQPVSTVNPRFVGEPFTFGEWTMDLAAATHAVATTNVNAYTLVLFTGALWCPYCMGMERDLLSTPAFKEFVRTNNIALVEIDNYKRDGSAPSLLRYAVYTGATNDTRNGHSGAGYLSRHGISVADAEEVQARNMAVQAAWTLPGATRIGYPTLLLLRKDGSIAGRFSGSYRMTDNTVIPAIQSFDLGVNLLRLHELLAQANDPLEADEERNGHYTTTTDTLGASDSVTASLRATDVKDVYVLRTAAGLRQTVAVSGSEEAEVQVAVLDEAGQTLQAQSGSLRDGLSMTAAIAGTGTVYAAVTASGAAVAVSNSNASVRSYRIETRYGLVPSEASQTLKIAQFAADGTFDTSLTTVSNRFYRFAASGAALTFPAGGFEAVGGDLYRALADGETAIRLTEVSVAAVFTWQVWNPGSVGFASAAELVSEADTNRIIVVQRTVGGSGTCSVSVTLDTVNTTATAGEDFTDVFGAGIVLNWADGETGAKTVSLPLLGDGGFEGDEVVALTLTVTEGAASLDTGRDDYRLTIVENDQPVIGRLAFVGGDLIFVKRAPLTVVAREGSLLTLGVERVDGASMAVSATVAATAGTVHPAVLTWANNDRVPLKTTSVTLPLLAAEPSGVVSLTLTTDSSIQTMPGKDAVKVQLVAANAPVFAQEAVAFSGQTRVAFDRTVPLLQTTGGRITFAKRSGALPSGLVAKYDQLTGGLRLTGVPKTTGTHTVVYQVSETRGAKTVAGGVAQLTITVVALETLNAAAADSVAGAEGAVIDKVSGRVVGTLSVSVTKTASLTAKYLSKTGTVTFSGKSWTACDENGTLTAALSKGNYELSVQLTGAGVVSAAVTDPAYAEPLEASLMASTWSASNPATDYVGYYTVSLSPSRMTGALAPTGYSYMTLSLLPAAARTGKVTYAGKLADGTSYSGSAVLQLRDDGHADFVLFTRKAKHVLAGVLSLTARASETYQTYPSAISGCGSCEPYWTCDSGNGETSFDIVLDICGGYYNSADSLLDYYALYAGTGPMELLAAGDLPQSGVYGTATALPFVALALSESSLKIPARTVDPTGTRLSFTKTTGVFRGTFKLPFISALAQAKTLGASYEGVLLPGWTGDCGCGENEVELPEKPFGMGAYWFTDRVPVETASGSQMKAMVRGYPLIINKAVE